SKRDWSSDVCSSDLGVLSCHMAVRGAFVHCTPIFLTAEHTAHRNGEIDSARRTRPNREPTRIPPPINHLLLIILAPMMTRPDPRRRPAAEETLTSARFHCASASLEEVTT